MGVADQVTDRAGGSPPSALAPDDMRQHVRAAYALLCEANKKAIQVPADVVNVITTARKADTAELPADLEARFWNAYGLLSSSIKPAERARTLYRWVFYVVLFFLLLFQFVFTAGDHVRGKVADIEKQLIEVRGRAVAPTGDPGSAAAGPAATIAPGQAEAATRGLLQSRAAYHRLSADVVAFAIGPLRYVGFFKDFFAHRGTERWSEEDDAAVKVQLELILAFLATYLLPMLYGLLGACAFVLRKLSDEIDKLTYAHDARVRYALRLNIGLLSGLAVGWFIKPGAADTTLLSLSPLALAFIAGYASELFFVALDRLVQAFAPSQGAAVSSVRETTSGGITAIETTTVDKVVAGQSPPAAPEARNAAPVAVEPVVGRAA
jgi:hypothetical protein